MSAECGQPGPPLRDYDARQPLAEGARPEPATEHRVTFSVTPISDSGVQAIIDDIRARFGRRPLVHVVDQRDRSSSVHDVTPPPEPAPEPEPGPHDMRRLTIEIECDVNLAAVSAARRDRPSPPYDVVTHVDRQVVAAVEALPGLSGVISRRLSMTDPRFGRGRS